MKNRSDGAQRKLQTTIRAGAWLLAGLLLHATPANAAGPCDAPVPPPFANCPKKPAPAPANAASALSAQASLGKLIFNDVALSASGQQSCATCHSPGSAFSAPNANPVPTGGINMNLLGLRNAPAVAYATFTPAFNLNGGGPAANPPGRPPVGGFMRDGRLASLTAQAQKPFLTSFEMANGSSAEVIQRLQQRPYLNQFTALFGSAILNTPDSALAAMAQAIAAFESQDPAFHAFSSKFDAFKHGQATLTAAETAGMQAFLARDRGNCESCHHSSGNNGGPGLFTDFSYHVLGVPRNWAIPYNLDSTALPSFVPANGASLGAPNHQYYDMGLCGPLRTDLAGNTALCGSFKVPTLRNVAVKKAYFHNGVFTSLNDVVSFYATRNSNPTRWYKHPDGSADILYNDLPVTYARNVEPVNAPGRPIAPNLSATDVRNLVSFLCTLTDGYDPANPGAYKLPAQCTAQ